MHIVLGVLAAVGAIAFFIIRANQVNRAGRELVETAGEVKGLIRRSRWKSKTKVDAFREIHDPRVAATAMMYAVAKADGDVTERQRSAILGKMGSVLRMSDVEAEEIFGQARWLLQDLHDTGTILRRAAPAIADSCGTDEIDDLLAMIEDIAAVEGDMTELQRQAIDGVRRKLRPDG